MVHTRIEFEKKKNDKKFNIEEFTQFFVFIIHINHWKRSDLPILGFPLISLVL